jgi:hypothetical protein
MESCEAGGILVCGGVLYRLAASRQSRTEEGRRVLE